MLGIWDVQVIACRNKQRESKGFSQNDTYAESAQGDTGVLPPTGQFWRRSDAFHRQCMWGFVWKSEQNMPVQK